VRDKESLTSSFRVSCSFEIMLRAMPKRHCEGVPNTMIDFDFCIREARERLAPLGAPKGPCRPPE
jgi:hypothetical protein